jgi:nicotinamidase-related amidase
VVDTLSPIDITIEKIVYSAFYMTRLEWVLRKCGIESLYVGGIVKNGGVCSTVRSAHVREFSCTGLERRDRGFTAGCADRHDRSGAR